MDFFPNELINFDYEIPNDIYYERTNGNRVSSRCKQMTPYKQLLLQYYYLVTYFKHVWQTILNRRKCGIFFFYSFNNALPIIYVKIIWPKSGVYAMCKMSISFIDFSICERCTYSNDLGCYEIYICSKTFADKCFSIWSLLTSFK